MGLSLGARQMRLTHLRRPNVEQGQETSAPVQAARGGTGSAKRSKQVTVLEVPKRGTWPYACSRLLVHDEALR